jgi:hypothetical protein
MEVGWLLGRLASGMPVWSGAFESLATNLQTSIDDALGEVAEVVMAAPPVVDLETARLSGYPDNFPQLAGFASVAEQGGLTAQAALLGAACHPYFALTAGSAPTVGRVCGHVFRWEPSDDPFRLVSFRQHEHVTIDTAALVRSRVDLWSARLMVLMTGPLGLEVELAAANDPFVGRLGNLKGDMQLEAGTKYEFVANFAVGDSVALASSNLHGSRLLRAFGGPSSLESACLGVGLERTILAVFATHGAAPGSWPVTVKEVLGLA